MIVFCIQDVGHAGEGGDGRWVGRRKGKAPAPHVEREAMRGREGWGDGGPRARPRPRPARSRRALSVSGRGSSSTSSIRSSPGRPRVGPAGRTDGRRALGARGPPEQAMEGASFGAGRAGATLDPVSFALRPQTLLRVMSWVSGPHLGTRSLPLASLVPLHCSSIHSPVPRPLLHPCRPPPPPAAG